MQLTQRPTVRRDARALFLAATVTAVPFLVVVFMSLGSNYRPVGDAALIDLRVRDVFSGDLPLVGVYSRYGWNHPGPVLLWALAPLNAIAGKAAWSTQLGTVLLQLGAVVLAGWSAWRRGGLALAMGVACVVLLVFAALGPQVLREPWNPYVALPAFAAVVLAAWGVAVGDRWQLPVAVVVGTFLVQVHIGYAILVGALLVAAGAMAFPWRRARGAAVRAWTRPAIAAGLAAVALWAAPLVEQTRDTPGNLRAIAAYVIHGRGTSVGFGHALGLLATEYRIPPPWLGATSPIALDRGATASSNLWLLVPLALLVTAAVVARRRGDRSGGAIIGLLVVANVAGVVALASTTGVPYDYLFLWRTLLAPLTLLGAAWVLARAIAADRPAFRRVPIAALAVVLVVAAGVVTRDIVDAPAAVAPAEPFVSAAAAKLVPRAAGRRVMLRLAGPETRGVFAGLLDALDARGVDVRTSTSLAFVVGRDRATGRRGADVIWVVVEDSRLVSELLGNPAAKVLVRRTPLSQGEDRELTRVHRRLSAELRAAGRGDLVNTVGTPLVNIALADAPVDPDAVARATTLNRRVDESATGRVAVFEFAPDRIPALPPTPILGT